jgi:hypothetical protein
LLETVLIVFQERGGLAQGPHVPDDLVAQA